jgi:uncharacterized protein YodC (DUF2158 family)
MNSEIQVGDVVVLKSGGPKMTVVGVYESKVADVIWMVGTERRAATIPIVALGKLPA